MEINRDHIEKRLRDALEPTYLNVDDFSGGCGLKFSATIVSEKFEGKPLLARQRFVNDLLKDEMQTIHAFTQQTYTPTEWEKKQQKSTGTSDNTNKTCSGLCGNAKQ